MRACELRWACCAGVGGFGFDDRLRVWLNAEEAVSKRVASKVMAIRFKGILLFGC